ncbi:ABCB10 [Symbiodinium necroappetens]|uniref:ABCB10 protein n=1 Tax=Symbiodinium necroappetens TaxID=1628268 RepID=A0A812JMW7_9DINO|nr:ABCB10 [Symbiodinium necroappetens]
MGLLKRSIEGFRNVAEASKTDPLLRAANWLVVIFPFYNAAGSLCSVHYSRYLDSRKKRLALAISCGAQLQLSVSKEEAEKDEWQIELLKAIAEDLKVPETRLTLQGLTEARGKTFLRVVLSRPAESESAPASTVLAALRGKGSGPLSAIEAVVVDGNRRDERKTYGLWLNPSGNAVEALQKAVTDLSSKFGGPSFTPHLTLLGPIMGEEQDVTDFAKKFAVETAPIPIEVEGLGLGSSFFRSICLEVKSSPELLAARALVSSLVPKSWLPAFLGGRSCQLDAQSQKLGFRPHISLGYTDGPAKAREEVAEETASLLETSFVAKELSVWETDLEDFTCKSWKQVASFKLEGKTPPSFWRLFRRFAAVAAPEFLRIGVGTGLSILANVAVDKACAHDMTLFSGKHAGKSNSELLGILSQGLLLWGLVNQLFDWSRWLMESAGDKIGCRLRGELFERLIQQDVKWISQKGADELYRTLMQRTDNVQRVFTRDIPELLNMVSNLITNVGLLWFRKPRLCAFGFGMFAFQNIGFGIFDAMLQVAQDHDAVTEEIKENALEVLQNFRIVRAFAREDREKQAFLKSIRQKLTRKMSSYVSFLTDIGSWFTGEFAFQVAYMYGGTLVNLNYIGAEEVREAVGKVFKTTWPLYRLKHRLRTKTTFAEDAEAVLEALKRPPAIPFEDTSKHNPAPAEIKGDIQAKSMSFSYTEDMEAAVLKDVTFTIPAGSMVGLVGPSGCGKSTLFNLFLRFYDPQNGSLEIDGISLANWNPQALYRAVAWVSQDQCVFQGSVLDNIRYGVPDASEEEVLRAMREADLYDDVMKKPQGVATPAAELSGGQKQRLSIARAVLTDPKILLLDEATSALDTVSERKVQKALESLMKGRTVIAIAHRLSTIMNANLIMVMESGKIIEQGTHAELLQKAGGKYANLVQQQLAVDDDSAKAETATDPKAVEDCALTLEQLRSRVPADLMGEVDAAVKALKDAATTLKQEKKRLALRERSLLGPRKWKAATTLRNAMRAIKLMRPAPASGPSPPLLLERALSTATEVAAEDPTAQIPLIRHLSE